MNNVSLESSWTARAEGHRVMRDDRWSIPVGQVRGVAIRVHLFFLLFAALTGYFVWHARQTTANQQDLALIALLSLAVLAASMLVHEAARCLVTRSKGGQAASVVVGPLLGLTPMTPPPLARDEMLAHLVAPLANLLLALGLLAALLAGGGYDPALLNPFSPVGAIEGRGPIVAVKLGFWVNWVIGLLNLLPAFPFAGGRALRAAILWRAPQLGRRVASRRVMIVARLTASLLIVAAISSWPQNPDSPLDGFALTLLAIFIFFSQEQDFPLTTEPAWRGPQARSATIPAMRRATTEVSPAGRDEPLYDGFSSEDVDFALAGEDSDDRFHSDADTSYEVEDGGIDEQRVDEILIRVHEHGMDRLSDKDRAFLERASARYRERRQLGASEQPQQLPPSC